MNLRVRLVPVADRRTDVLCIGCNKFRADLMIEGSEYGMHKKCVPTLQVRFTRRRGGEPKDPRGVLEKLETPC